VEGSNDSLLPDVERIIGVWRIVSRKSKGSDVSSAVQFYSFEPGGVLRKIAPDTVDDGKWRRCYRLNEDRCEIIVTTDYVADDGKCKPAFMHKVQCGIYNMDGGELKLCWGSHDQFPEKVCDDRYEVETL